MTPFSVELLMAHNPPPEHIEKFCNICSQNPQNWIYHNRKSWSEFLLIKACQIRIQMVFHVTFVLFRCVALNTAEYRYFSQKCHFWDLSPQNFHSTKTSFTLIPTKATWNLLEFYMISRNLIIFSRRLRHHKTSQYQHVSEIFLIARPPPLSRSRVIVLSEPNETSIDLVLGQLEG